MFVLASLFWYLVFVCIPFGLYFVNLCANVFLFVCFFFRVCVLCGVFLKTAATAAPSEAACTEEFCGIKMVMKKRQDEEFIVAGKKKGGGRKKASVRRLFLSMPCGYTAVQPVCL